MSKLSKVDRPWVVIISSFVFVIGSVVVLLVVILRSPETPTIVAEEEPVVPESTALVMDPEVFQEVIEPSDPWYGTVTLADLMEACPDPFMGRELLSEECRSMLEPFFIELPYIPELGFQWLHLPERMTYRRIFEAPQQDRALVLDALQRPECCFEDGEQGVRAELRESCHAESFYVMASFTSICFRMTDSRNIVDDYGFKWYYEPTEVVEEHLTELATGLDGRLNQTQYTRFKEDVWHTALVDHWYRMKCEEYDSRSMTIDREDRDAEFRDLLQSMLARLSGGPPDRRTTGYRNADYDDALYAIAAHLGDFSASLLFVSRNQYHAGYNVISSSFFRQMIQQYPWRYELREARNLREWKPIQWGRPFVYWI